MTLLDKELTKAEQGMWWTITAPLAFTKATTDYYSLREKYPKLFSEAKWSRPDTYTSMGFTVAFFKQAQWVYLGAEIDEPEFECPKSYYAASIGGIEGLDFNVPTGILSRSAGDLLQSRIARTPKNMNAKYFKGLSFPLELRSGTKRKSLPSSASLSSSSSSSSSSSDSSSSSSDSDSDYGPDPDSDSDGYFSDGYFSDAASSSSSSSSSSSDDDDDGDGDGDELPDAPPPSSSSSDDPFTLITTTLAANDPALGLRVLLHLFKLSAVLVLLLASPESLKVVLSLILSSSAYQTSKHLYTVAKNKRRQLWVKIPLMGSDTKLGRVRTDKLPWDGILQGLGCGDVHEAAKRCVLSRDPSGAATRAGRRRATGASGMGAKLRGGGARRLGASTGDQRQGKPGGAGGESGRGYVLMYPLLRCNII